MNWNQRLQIAEIDGHFTQDDKEESCQWNVLISSRPELQNMTVEYDDVTDMTISMAKDFSKFVNADDVTQAKKTFNIAEKMETVLK